MAIKRRTEIACILCKNIVKFPEYVGKDYNGDLLCDACGSLLGIKLEKGEVKGFRVKERVKGRKDSKRMEELQDKFYKLKHDKNDDKDED